MQELIDKRRYLEGLGWDFFPVKQLNGSYRISVWKGDQTCYGEGKKEYTCWKDGVNKTIEDFYTKFKGKHLKDEL